MFTQGLAFYDQNVTVTTPIAINTNTNHATFVVREDFGANAGRHLLVDLDAERDGYRRRIFTILQLHNAEPFLSIVGARLRVSGILRTKSVYGQPTQQILHIHELQLSGAHAIYRPYSRVQALYPADLYRHFNINAGSRPLANTEGSDGDGTDSGDSDGGDSDSDGSNCGGSDSDGSNCGGSDSDGSNCGGSDSDGSNGGYSG